MMAVSHTNTAAIGVAAMSVDFTPPLSHRPRSSRSWIVRTFVAGDGSKVGVFPESWRVARAPDGLFYPRRSGSKGHHRSMARFVVVEL